MSQEAATRLESLTRRRARREPLSYVLGWTEFHSLSFSVTPAVVTPRPETEILVDAALSRVRDAGPMLFVDVGTGSGAIAVALARARPQARVVAIDISPAALAVAGENCGRHGVLKQVHRVCGDLLSGVGARADGIVANLPYIGRDEFPYLEPEVREFEPREGLDGGEDGLQVIRRLSVQLLEHLADGGLAALEVGAGQALEVAKLLAAEGLSRIEVVRDLAGIERVVLGWRAG
jgi:release factor glutamine methyltransferase